MISVIIPVYNVERYIRQCLESVLSQTYRDLEILIIDDGSTDGCGGICDEYAAADSRVRVIHQPNEGVSAARNAGLGAATGEYIGFVDPDDWIEPRMFEVMLDTLLSSDADISVCAYWYEYVSRRKPVDCIGESVFRGDEITRVRMCGRSGNTLWNKLFRRCCWEELKFPLSRNFEDVATVYRTLIKAGTVAGTSERLYHYRKRVGSITTAPTMKNIRDHWLSYSEKYYCMNALVHGTDEEAANRDWLRTEVAWAAVRPFRWLYGVPKEERDHGLLDATSRFLRENFSAAGDKGWGVHLRIVAILARRTNAFTCAVTYCLNRIFQIVKKAAGKKELYP